MERAAKESEYWDIEGQLEAAIVKALKAAGFNNVTEMLSGDTKAGSRVEVMANLMGEDGREGIDSNSVRIRTGYRAAVALEVFSPLGELDQHRRLRGNARAFFAFPRGLKRINAHLPFGEVVDIVTGESANTLATDQDDFDEIATAMSYTLTLSLNGGSAPLTSAF